MAIIILLCLVAFRFVILFHDEIACIYLAGKWLSNGWGTGYSIPFLVMVHCLRYPCWPCCHLRVQCFHLVLPQSSLVQFFPKNSWTRNWTCGPVHQYCWTLDHTIAEPVLKVQFWFWCIWTLDWTIHNQILQAYTVHRIYQLRYLQYHHHQTWVHLEQTQYEL